MFGSFQSFFHATGFVSDFFAQGKVLGSRARIGAIRKSGGLAKTRMLAKAMPTMAGLGARGSTRPGGSRRVDPIGGAKVLTEQHRERMFRLDGGTKGGLGLPPAASICEKGAARVGPLLGDVSRRSWADSSSQRARTSVVGANKKKKKRRTTRSTVHVSEPPPMMKSRPFHSGKTSEIMAIIGPDIHQRRKKAGGGSSPSGFSTAIVRNAARPPSQGEKVDGIL